MAKIMAVEDKPETLQLIRKIVERAGHVFVGCSSGEECLEIYEREKPDLILLDILLPGMDGYEVFERIKQKTPQQRIAFLSALDIAPRTLVRLQRYGRPPYITKPFDPEELVRKIDQILRGE